MKYSILFFLFAIWFLPVDAYSQKKTLPKLSVDMVDKQGILIFKVTEAWKYHPGDNLQWADPDFDDSQWYDLAPGDLSIDKMPDSLWNGYGWWRYTFTADSSFYNKNWNLYFSGWGAAEVYLDGQLVHQFGQFSINPEQEKTYSTINKLFPPVKIAERNSHIIAVRYSFHQAKRFNEIIKINAGNLGFGLGFATHKSNQLVAEMITYHSLTLFISAAVLFVLFLLHLMLYYKFPEERSNLLISIVVGLLLISDVTIFSFIYSDVRMYWYSILTWIWSLSGIFAILLLPYVIAEIFKLGKLKKVGWLMAVFPLMLLLILLNLSVAFNYIDNLALLISLFLVGYICWKAYRSGKRGVGYVAFGALGTLSLVVIYTLYSLGFIAISFKVYYIMITFLYTLFPLGMTLYVADSYGYLFTSMEKEITERTKKLKQSIENLKTAQTQLVQQEKLASLGQLTAGIAHEIKNPLNFVNNFSELSSELIDEAFEEMQKMDNCDAKEETLAILKDVKGNLIKVHEHGSRANNIVSSMLQHSRGGSGKMEPTHLNALVKEYVNLSFHGMRAGKNPINVSLEYDLEESIGKVPLVAEDFSRVIVNLCNNAFDAMRETANNRPPKLTLRTRMQSGKIIIEVEDNGPGIPQEIKDKILQPFFTTKKGTEGTGLGLSLSYDIIKAHNGELKVETKEGEACPDDPVVRGTTFIISLPLNKSNK